MNTSLKPALLLDELEVRAEPRLGDAMSADAFENLPKFAKKYELIKGVVTMSPAGYYHDVVVAWLIVELGIFLRQHRLGTVGASSAGFKLSAKDVFSPDVSFTSFASIPEDELPQGYATVAPDLAVEIVSPFDRANEVEEKVEAYFFYGVRLVWVINPTLRIASIYRANGTTSRIQVDGFLDGEDILPGFQCRLIDILQSK